MRGLENGASEIKIQAAARRYRCLYLEEKDRKCSFVSFRSQSSCPAAAVLLRKQLPVYPYALILSKLPVISPKKSLENAVK
jgi:hypothetical protein